MVNRFYRRQPYDVGLYVPPIDAIQQTLANAQKNYDTNYAMAESIKNNFIPSLPQDRAEANRIQDHWNSQIDEIVSSYSGDYSRAGKKLATLLSSIRKDYNPGGKAHAIATNYNNYKQWLGEHQKRVADGKVLAEDLNAANNYFMNQYQGVGEIDPTTGSYNQFNPEYLSDYQDPNKIIQDIFKEFKPEKRSVGVTSLKNGIFEYNKHEIEGIDPNRLLPSFVAGLGADPKFSTYINQVAKFKGLKPEQVTKYILNYSAQRANDLGYMNDLTDSKWERDPLAVAREKARLDRQNMMDIMGGLLQYNPSVGSAFQLEPQIDHTNWRGSVLKDYLPTPGDIVLGTDLVGSSPAGLLAAPLISSFRASNSKIADDKTNLDQFLNNSSNDKILASKNVIPDLAKAMWERQKGYLGDEFKQKYGKDKKYTQQVEQDFWYNYKGAAKKNASTLQSYAFEIPEPAKEQALRMLPDAVNGNAAIYEPGVAGQTTKIPSSIAKSLFNKDGKLNIDQISIKYVVPSAGYEAAGFEISTPKGRFVLVDPNYQRSQLSKQMASALNPIFQNGKSQGAGLLPYRNLGRDAQGNSVLEAGVPHVKWEYNNATGDWDQNIYMHERDGSPIKDSKGNLVKTTLPEIMDTNIPFFSSSLGFGQTKAAATPFEYFMLNHQ